MLSSLDKVLAVVLVFFPIISWISISEGQRSALGKSTFRTQVLMTRSSLVLPILAILVCLALFFPLIGYPVEVVIAFVEGKLIFFV